MLALCLLRDAGQDQLLPVPCPRITQQVRWSGVLGNQQGRRTIITRLMDTHLWCLPASSVWGGLSKGTMVLPVLFSGRRLPLQFSPKSQTIQFLPIYPQCLSSCCPMLELRESASKFMCDPFKRNACDSRSPLSHSATIPTGF